MAWMITLISGVNEMNNNLVGCIEDEGPANEVGALLVEIYNREFPEYSYYMLSKIVDGPS